MNEREILDAIGYNGEYNKEVKKNLKGLLKKYHPDHYKGSDDTFKLINKVKRELEAGKKPTIKPKVNKKKTYNNDDYLWYANQIDELTKKRNELLEKKENKQKRLFSLQDEYKDIYDIDINNRNDENDNANSILVLQENRQVIYTLLYLLIVISLIFVFTKIYYPIIILVILIIIMIIKLVSLHKEIKSSIKVNEKAINKSKKSFEKISNINEEINDLYHEIWELDCEIGRLNTKINLYYNHIK